jgi:hypothetical protein
VNPGEVFWSLQSTDSTTCGAGAMLTSLRGSLATSRRRSDGGDEKPTAVALDLGLGLWWRLRTGKAARVRGVPEAALLIKARAVSLACGPRGDVVLQPDSGGNGGGVRSGDDAAEGMTGGTHGSATQGVGGGKRLAQLGLAAG